MMYNLPRGCMVAVVRDRHPVAPPNRSIGYRQAKTHRLAVRETTMAPDVIVREGDAYDLIRELPANSVDLVLTSPPYWGQRTYERAFDWRGFKDRARRDTTVPSYDDYRRAGGVLGLEPLPEWYVAHLVEILDAAMVCLKPAGSIWLNIGDTYFARWSSVRQRGRQGLGDQGRERRVTPMGGYRQEKQLLMVPARFAIAMQERRWILRNDLIWCKPNIPPRPETDRLRLAHEHFFHFVKRPKEGRPKYYYDLRFVEPRALDVVIYHVRSGQNGHTATFPPQLVRPRILSSCPPEGLVLDPFCGSGRALTVALDCGRRALGFEISPEYVKAARENVRTLRGVSGDHSP